MKLKMRYGLQYCSGNTEVAKVPDLEPVYMYEMTPTGGFPAFVKVIQRSMMWMATADRLVGAARIAWSPASGSEVPI